MSNENKQPATPKFEVTRHRPTDTLDPGFAIKGHKLRWIHGFKAEGPEMSIWKVLKKDELQPEQLKSLQQQIPGLFSGGNTIRKRDLVLAYAPMDSVKEVRAEVDKANQEAMQRIYNNPTTSPHVSVDPKETEVKRGGAEIFKE